MNEINHRKANRYKILKAMYETTEANPRRWADAKAITSHLGFFENGFRSAYHYLINEGLMSLYGRGYTATITHQGIKAIEDADSNPGEPTYYFPAVCEMGSMVSGDVEGY